MRTTCKESVGDATGSQGRPGPVKGLVTKFPRVVGEYKDGKKVASARQRKPGLKHNFVQQTTA